MNFPRGCMGIPPDEIKGPCALACDCRYGSYDVLAADIQRPKPGITIPRLVFAGKVEDERAVLFLQDQYRVRCSVMDSRPDATIAARFQQESRRKGIRCFRAQYLSTVSNRRVSVDEKEGLITLDRTMVLDDVMQRMATAQFSIPQNYREITQGAFVSELCNSNREPVIWHGIPTFMWKNSGDDHTHHAAAYLLLAIELGRLDAGSSEALLPQKGLVTSSLEDLDEEEEEAESRHWRRGGVVHEA